MKITDQTLGGTGEKLTKEQMKLIIAGEDESGGESGIAADCLTTACSLTVTSGDQSSTSYGNCSGALYGTRSIWVTVCYCRTPTNTEPYQSTSNGGVSRCNA